MKRWKKGIPFEWKSKEIQGINIYTDKIAIKDCYKRNEGYYLTIKWLIQEENITIVNKYALNIEAHQHIKQISTDIKG